MYFEIGMFGDPVRDKRVKYCYVYVMSNPKGKWYTGFTSNLRKRFNQHVAGESTYTKHRGPWELIYFEGCNHEDDARSRELFLKSGMGKRYLKNRLKRFLSLTG